MSRPTPVRGRAEATRVVQTVAATMSTLTTAGTTVSHLIAAIEARLNDGIRAATYDGDGRSTGGATSPTERAALARGDAAHDDLHALYRHLADLAAAEVQIAALMRRYPCVVGRMAKPGTDRKPGKGAAPAGACRTCWTYGLREQIDVDRYARECRWCGDERAKIGQRVPREVWEHHRQGRRVTLATYRQLAPEIAAQLTAAS